MWYKRQYLQYNSLVFDAADMVSGDNPGTSFKTSDTEYTFIHGSYAPHKRLGGLVRAGGVSLTITLSLKKLPCEVRPYYIRFVKSQLTTQGKLWAVQDNTLVWAHAHLTNWDEDTDSRKDELIIDVDFDLPEGIWHKADKQKTFLVPWDVCDFMDCYEWKDVQPCKISTTDCCKCGKTEKIFCDCCDDCNHLEKEMALCYHTGEIQDFYARCGSGYRIVYDCDAANKFFGDYWGEEHPGQKFCADCGQVIAGQFYSDTDLPTDNIKILLHGDVNNPYIEINGNGNIIKGSYSGTLEINSDGSVFSYDDCGACGPLDVSRWVIPNGMTYGWTIHQGNNRVVIDSGTCCHVCAYIIADSWTF